jgi:hypothetical protein
MITKNKNTSGPARFDLSVRFPWERLIEMIFESLLPENKMPDASMFHLPHVPHIQLSIAQFRT